MAQGAAILKQSSPAPCRNTASSPHCQLKTIISLTNIRLGDILFSDDTSGRAALVGAMSAGWATLFIFIVTLFVMPTAAFH